MGIRKNAKFLTPTERENFVRACVLLKAHIVNPAAPANQQYSKWDEYVAIHQMIQSAFAPGSPNVNFGHGGSGAYSFLSWHRYFLLRLELDLQSKVGGVMVPYWDWSDPAPIMTDTFIGPNGTVNNEVRSGYFAVDAPGTGSNPTPSPAWWPAGLVGWRLPAAFGMFAGALRRAIGMPGSLVWAADMVTTLGQGSYATFQSMLESGAGLMGGGPPMHNAMHSWWGGGGHMSSAQVSSFDPIFFLHHANVDRLWAMWQADGHATDYPLAGGLAQHHRNDLMYPWVGAAAGYGTNAGIAASIPMPDFSALGGQRNVDTLDHRALGYTYDCIAVIGLGLDRTGSMLGSTPDPMTSGAPDVSKWEAAKRGVSAFLQDCEAVQASGRIYTVVGIKTFRRLGSNDFAPVFGAPGYGLVKAGTPFSRAAFDAAVAPMTPGGDTPLADALLDVRNTLVNAPFGNLPAGEPRWLAMLTDGLLTSGSPMNSIANGSFAPTAVFSMGFGTGLDVDYPTLQSMVDKGRALGTQQVFHGETAGTIDKFYSNALAAAIGFTTVFDPVIELFAGEHTHLEFDATSAEDCFLVTAQGMDFDDANWSFTLHGPDGTMVFGDGLHGAHPTQGHAMGCGHCCKQPRVTARRASGRLSLVLERDGADAACWVGRWQLMVAYRARQLDAMVMFSPDTLMTPTAAGTVRGGPRHTRLLVAPKARTPQRSLRPLAAHPLDSLPPGTNRDTEAVCSMVVTISAQTRLRHTLVADKLLPVVGEDVSVQVQAEVLHGALQPARAFARSVAPCTDIAALADRLNPKHIQLDKIDREKQLPRFDAALALAKAERQEPGIGALEDLQQRVAVHGGPAHVHLHALKVPGPVHLSVYLEGDYLPDAEEAAGGGTAGEHGHDHGGGNEPPAGGRRERYTRLLSTLVPVVAPPKS